jgi:hypothetical protein
LHSKPELRHAPTTEDQHAHCRLEQDEMTASQSGLGSRNVLPSRVTGAATGQIQAELRGTYFALRASVAEHCGGQPIMILVRGWSSRHP